MITLYHVLPEGDPLRGSREASKVAVALREIGCEWKLEAVSRERDLRPPDGEYRRRVNPMGTVPALVDDGEVLVESGAILVHLGEKFPEAGLLPPPGVARARTLRWVFWECTTLVLALINLCYRHPFKALDAAAFEAVMPFREAKDPQAELAIAYQQMNHRLGVLDAALEGHEFIANDRYSIADIALGQHVALAGRLDLDLKPFANVARWLSALAERPAWRDEPVFAEDWALIAERGLI